MNSVIASLLVAHAEATETSFLKPVQLHQRELWQASTLKETAKGDHGEACNTFGKACNAGECKKPEKICCLRSETVKHGRCVDKPSPKAVFDSEKVSSSLIKVDPPKRQNLSSVVQSAQEAAKTPQQPKPEDLSTGLPTRTRCRADNHPEPRDCECSYTGGTVLHCAKGNVCKPGATSDTKACYTRLTGLPRGAAQQPAPETAQQPASETGKSREELMREALQNREGRQAHREDLPKCNTFECTDPNEKLRANPEEKRCAANPCTQAECCISRTAQDRLEEELNAKLNRGA